MCHFTKYLIYCLFGISSSCFASHSQDLTAPHINSTSTALSAAQAFELTAKFIDPTLKRVNVQINIVPGNYLYQDTIKITSLTHIPISVALPSTSTQNIYKDSVIFSIQLTEPKFSQGFIIEYQGCNEAGICFAKSSATILCKDKHIQIIPNTAGPPIHAAQLNILPIVTTLFLFLVSGLLLSFSPCILPLVPVMMHIIIGHTENISTKRTVYLTSLYVISQALSYTLAGYLFANIGQHVSYYLQHAYIKFLFASLLVFFALLQLEVIKFPSFQILSFTPKNTARKSGSVYKALGLGFTAILIVSPCITPALAGALTYITERSQPILGGLALFCLGVGLGLPFMIMACLGKHYLPKKGPWMQHIKNFCGLLLLALALDIIKNFIKPCYFYTLWGMLGVGVLALIKPWPKLRLLIAVAGLSIALYLWCLPYINTNTALSLVFTAVDSPSSFQTELQNAQRIKKNLFLKVQADWCSTCKHLESIILNDQEIVRKLQAYHLVSLDLSQALPLCLQLQQALHIVGPPALLIYDIQGKPTQMLVGDIDKKVLLDALH